MNELYAYADPTDPTAPTGVASVSCKRTKNPSSKGTFASGFGVGVGIGIAVLAGLVVVVYSGALMRSRMSGSSSYSGNSYSGLSSPLKGNQAAGGGFQSNANIRASDWAMTPASPPASL